MEVHQLVSSLVAGDAISNFALFLNSLLKEEGFQSEIFAERVSAELTDRCHHLGKYPPLDSSEKILIAHYSIASMGMVTLPRFKARKILFYHNVTPYQFWVDINPLAAFHCLRGRTDLKEILPFVNYGIGLSEFSLKDLRDGGLEKTSWLPLPLDVSRLKASPDPVTLRLLEGNEKKILVVGRVAPNKRFDKAIQIASMLPGVQLIVAGTWRDSAIYYYALLETLKQSRVKCVFAGHVSQEELNALYQSADVLLITSDHEGFCVPILEAFYFQLPVIAQAAGAIPDTSRGGALLFEPSDLEMAAGLISRVFNDPALRSHLQAKGNEVLQQYLEFPFRETLLNIIQEVASMPPLFTADKY